MSRAVENSAVFQGAGGVTACPEDSFLSGGSRAWLACLCFRIDKNYLTERLFYGKIPSKSVTACRG